MNSVLVYDLVIVVLLRWQMKIKPDTNHSQFFITLDAADWLTGKHTIFGKVVGNTLFNVLKMGELETDKEDHPLYPPVIKSISVIVNPF